MEEKKIKMNEVWYDNYQDFLMHMAEVERKAPPLTLECLAYRAAKWKYNLEIPSHISEPYAYPSTYVAKPIEEAYDQARELGYTGARFFVKHGLWGALYDYNIKLNDAFKYFKNDEISCFVCHIKKRKYPFIERDPPHDNKMSTLCDGFLRIGIYCHFLHHFKGYDDAIDYRMYISKDEPDFKYSDFWPRTRIDLPFARRRGVYLRPGVFPYQSNYKVIKNIPKANK